MAEWIRNKFLVMGQRLGRPNHVHNQIGLRFWVHN